MLDFHFEREVLEQGFNAVAGLDEAGRGALFGPVVAASVMFPHSFIRNKISGWLGEIDDSKRLSAVKRKKLFRQIVSHASSIGFGLVTNIEIDNINIHRASLEAMKRAVATMPTPPGFLLVDGFSLDDVNYPQRKIVQGDQKSISIAAASIVAKVLRDEMIIRIDQIFEGYALAKNKGYATREHYSALQNMGPSVFHRRSFKLNRENRETDYEK
jgi:ribonuclease HII